jgi:DNA-binding Lrp family transcriptional regulator
MSERAPRPSNAWLQDEIILFLMAEGKVDTISELARKLGAARPSVSRAINALASGGIVYKDGRQLALTKSGREEALRLWERRSGRPERYEMRPVIEALNSFADSAKDLERISEQIQLLSSLTEDAPRTSREEVRHLQSLFDGLTEMMEPLKELADRMRPVLSKFESSEEAELPELDVQDVQLLVELARAYERARWLLDLVSDGMEALTSLIDKMQSAQVRKATAEVERSKDAPHPGGEVAIPH